MSELPKRVVRLLRKLECECALPVLEATDYCVQNWNVLKNYEDAELIDELEFIFTGWREGSG